MPFLRYEFQELPLTIDRGFEGFFVDGVAEISFHLDGEWAIRAIYAASCRVKTGRDIPTIEEVSRGVSLFDRRPVELDREDPLYRIVLCRLENEWRYKIVEAVNDAIAEERPFMRHLEAV